MFSFTKKIKHFFTGYDSHGRQRGSHAVKLSTLHFSNWRGGAGAVTRCGPGLNGSGSDTVVQYKKVFLRHN
jgi:hypothetical protein